MVVLTKRAILQKAGGHRTAEKCQLQRRERLQREIWKISKYFDVVEHPDAIKDISL